MPEYEVTVVEVRRVTLRCVVGGADDSDQASSWAEDGAVDSEELVNDSDYDVLDRQVVDVKVRACS